MKKIKLHDFVFAYKYAVIDWDAPWAIGHITACGIDIKGLFYMVDDGLTRYRYCRKITKKEEEELIEDYRTNKKPRKRPRWNRYANLNAVLCGGMTRLHPLKGLYIAKKVRIGIKHISKSNVKKPGEDF